MLNNNKIKIKPVIMNLWQINTYPIKLSNALYDMAWERAEQILASNNKDFKNTLYQEGLSLIKLTELCKEIYINKEINNSYNIEELLIKLNNLRLKGKLTIVKSNNNRKVIQWEYTLKIDKTLDNWSVLSINNILKSIKVLDMYSMNQLIKEYNYQEQESWSLNNNYIGCYIGNSIK
jgi:hypothetical protein